MMSLRLFACLGVCGCGLAAGMSDSFRSEAEGKTSCLVPMGIAVNGALFLFCLGGPNGWAQGIFLRVPFFFVTQDWKC